MTQNMKLIIMALLIFLISMSVGMLVNTTFFPSDNAEIQRGNLQNNLIYPFPEDEGH